MDGVAVGVVVVPGAASHRGQQVHCGVLVRYDAVRLPQGCGEVLVAVEALPLCGRAVVVAGGLDEVGHDLPVGGIREGVGVVPEDVQLALCAVGVVVCVGAHPLEDGAAAGGVGDHIMEAAAGRVMKVVLLGQRHGVLHRVRIVEDEAEQGGGGDVGPVGLGIGGRALALALIGHEDAAGHTCVVDAVQRHIGSREGQELLADGLHVLVRVEAEEAQVDGGVGGMAALAGVRIDDGRIGGREIVVAAKDPVAALGVRRKGRAGDAAGLDVHGNDALGDAPGNERDQLRIVGCAALRQKLVEEVIAREVDLVDRAVAVGFVPVGELLERGEGRQLVVPEGEHGDGQRDDQCRQRAGDAAQQLRERVTLHGDLLKKSRNIDKILEHFITTFVVLQGFWGDKGAKKQAL